MYLMYGILKPFYDTCHGHGNIALTVEGCPDLARRFFSGYFKTIMVIGAQPDMLEHSFLGLWTSNFMPNNFH